LFQQKREEEAKPIAVPKNAEVKKRVRAKTNGRPAQDRKTGDQIGEEGRGGEE